MVSWYRGIVALFLLWYRGIVVSQLLCYRMQVLPRAEHIVEEHSDPGTSGVDTTNDTNDRRRDNRGTFVSQNVGIYQDWVG